MKVILSTDFSEENKNLLPYAIDLLKENGGTIIVFHAYYDNICVDCGNYPGSMNADNFISAEFISELEKNAQQLMDEKTEYLKNIISQQNIHNITVIPKLMSGDPIFSLPQLAKIENPDFILMGTTGKGKKRFLEGKLAKSVMTRVSAPLLSIPNNYQWVKSTEVLYVTDFKKFDIHIINQIIKVLQMYEPHIHILHLLTDDTLEREALKNLNEIEEYYSNKELSGTVHFQLVSSSHPAEALKLFCEQNDISLVSFIANRSNIFDRLFRETISKDDYLNLGIPILSFNESIL